MEAINSVNEDLCKFKHIHIKHTKTVLLSKNVPEDTNRNITEMYLFPSSVPFVL